MHNHEKQRKILGIQDFPCCFVCGHVIQTNVKSPLNLNINHSAIVLSNELSIMACFTSGNRVKEKGGSRANWHVIENWFTLDVRPSIYCEAKHRNVHTLELALGLLPNFIVA